MWQKTGFYFMWTGPAVTNIFKLLNSILNSNHWGSLSWEFPQFTVTNHFEEGLSWGLKFTLNSVVWVARIKTRYFADFLRSVLYVIKVVVCVLIWLNMAENDIESLISAAKRKRGANWSSEEQIVLREEVLKYENKLFGKMKGTGAKGKHGKIKEETWQSITDRLNS